MTRAAFLNAVAVVMATAGSTNAVLHLLAIANEAEVELTMDDFDAVSRRVPHIVDMRPGGRYVMADVDRVGGLPVVLRELLEAGLLDGDVPHRHRQDHGREPGRVDPPEPDGEVIRRVAHPIAAEGGLAVLRGSLAPAGSVVKIPGNPNLTFRGTAKVFESEEDCFAAVTGGRVGKGDVLVIRYEGPKGGPGMREMLAVTGAIKGAGPGKDVAADHRRPLLRRHPRLLRRPRRPRGGRRRPHRLRRGRRPRSRSTWPPTAIDLRGRRGRAGPAPPGLEAARAPLHHAARWPSTPALVGGADRGAVCG